MTGRTTSRSGSRFGPASLLALRVRPLPRPVRSARKIATLLLCICLLGSCTREASPGKVVVLGLDGLEPTAIDLLMSEGKMPNFARLRQEGAYGRLISSKPLLSPIIWTTIATGKLPDQHKIGHFVTVNEKTGEQLPVTSQIGRAHV